MIAKLFAGVGLALCGVGVLIGLLSERGFAPDTAASFLPLFGVGWLALAGVLAVTIHVKQRRYDADRDLFTSGTVANATVERAHMTASTDGAFGPKVQLSLRVAPEGLPAFTASVRVFVDPGAMPRVGDTFPVAYDPKRPHHIVLRDFGARADRPLKVEVRDPPKVWALGLRKTDWLFPAIGVVIACLPYTPGTTPMGTSMQAWFWGVGAVFIGGFLPRAFSGRRGILRARRDTQLFRDGVRGIGTFEQVHANYDEVTNLVNVRVKFTLGISAPGVDEFTRSYSMLMPARSVPGVGDTIDVALDGNRPPYVALRTDWDTDTRGGRTLVLRPHGVQPGATTEVRPEEGSA